MNNQIQKWKIPEHEDEWIPNAHQFIGKNIFDAKRYILQCFPNANVQFLILGGYPQLLKYTVLLYHDNATIVRAPIFKNIPLRMTWNK